MKAVTAESANFDNEVVGGNKGGSDHQPNKRSINMVFTRPMDLGPLIFDNEVMDYLAYSEEVGKDGYKHYQGFVSWKCARWTYACKKKYGHWFNWMKGHLIQNDDYCSKQNSLTEFGVRPKQGHRTDLDRLRDRIMSGESVDTITIENPMAYHQYGRTLNRIEDIVMRERHRTEMTTCEWIYGDTGVGKSHTAYANYSNKTHYSYPYDTNGWWDGYKGQEVVIFNEFRGQIQYSRMLDLIDKWPCSVPRRGREPAPFVSRHIIITSSLHPKDVYHNISANDSLEQLLDRIKLIHLTGPNMRNSS